MRPPRLRCTLFPLTYPPHLLVLPATFGLHLFWQTYPYFRALYVISVRRTKSLLTASFRFHLTIDTLAVRLYTSSLPRRVRDFHPLERAPGAQTKKEPLPYGNGSFNNSWAEVDSNHRSNLQQIYSLSPLATRESAHLSMCPDRGKLYHSLSRYASYKFKKCHLFSINARKTKGFPGVAVHSGNQSFLHIRIPYNIPSLITS